MLQKLYDLIFGQVEFDKTKIDVRFELAQEIIKEISIKNLDDFEKVEACIYKIRDQLRVPSSNLNRVIKDKSKTLSQKKVDNILNKLIEIRSKFLTHAWDAIKQHPELKNEYNLEETTSVSQENVSQKKIQNLLILNSNQFQVELKNGKSPYLEINFKEEVNMNIIKVLSSVLFDVMQAHGTNIIINQNQVLIIPRFTSDEVFNSLPQIESNLDEIESKLKGNLKDAQFSEKEKKGYIELDQPKREQSMSQREESLDALLSDLKKENPQFTNEPDPQKDKNDIKFEFDDPIKIEKKAQKKDFLEVQKKTKQEIKQEIEIDEDKFTIYKDQEIHAFLNSRSKIVGELCIEHSTGLNFSQLNESQLSYVMIFSKIISSVLFEVMQAHGTNLIMDQSSNTLKIVPRFQNDKLDFTWENLKHSEEFLEQIKGKLLDKMQEEVKKENLSKEPKKISSNNETFPAKKEKIKDVIAALRKIP